MSQCHPATEPVLRGLYAPTYCKFGLSCGRSSILWEDAISVIGKRLGGVRGRRKDCIYGLQEGIGECCSEHESKARGAARLS